MSQLYNYTYEAYLEYLSQYEPSASPMPIEDWYNLTIEEQNSRLANVIPNPAKLNTFATKMPTLSGLTPKQIVTDVLGSTIDAAANLPQSVINAEGIKINVRTKIKNIVEEAVASNIIGTKVPPRDTDQNSDGDNSRSSKMITNNYTPVRVRISSPIIPRVYTDWYQDHTASASPIHLQFMRFRLPTDFQQAHPILSTYCTSILPNAISSAAQNRVRFDVRPSENFTYNKIAAYFNAVIEAMEVYYYIASLHLYMNSCNGSPNIGMKYLYDGVFSTDLELLPNLLQLICDYPIPPRLAMLINWMNSNYSFSDNDGASLLKLVPIDYGKQLQEYITTINSPNLISDVIRKLEDVRPTSNLLNRIFPEWRGVGKNTPSGVVLTDVQFNNLWTNAPFFNGNGYVARPDGVTSTDYAYQSYSPVLDGLILGLYVYPKTSTTLWPALVESVNIGLPYQGKVLYHNRFSFSKASNLQHFARSSKYEHLTDARSQYTRSQFVDEINSAYAALGDGAVEVRGVNGESVADAQVKTLDWLLDVGNCKTERKEFKGRSNPKG